MRGSPLSLDSAICRGLGVGLSFPGDEFFLYEDLRQLTLVLFPNLSALDCLHPRSFHSPANRPSKDCSPSPDGVIS